MPARIRHSPLGAGLSLADLNILPFLAPRLLQAWPRSHRGQRTQSTASVRLEKTDIQSLDGQPSNVSAAVRQPPPSGDISRRPQTQLGLSHDRSDGRRGTSIRPPSLDPVDTTRFYPQRNTGDIATVNENRSVLPHPEIADETPIEQDKSFNHTRKEVTGPYFSEAHLDILYDFLKAYRKKKNIEDGRQYFGSTWDGWFGEMRNGKQIKHSGRGSKRSRKLESIANFDPNMDVNALRALWMCNSAQCRETYWPGVMLDILSKRPDDALKFLTATVSHPLPYRRCIEDSLDYIVEHHLYRQSHSPISSEDFAVLFDTINDLLGRFHSTHFSISSYAIYHICKHASRLQAESLYETLSRRRQKFTPSLRLHFVDCFARRGATDSAVAILESMQRDGVVDFTEPRVASVCATLLRCSQQNPEALHSESHIYSLLLEWGIRPTIIFYTILAHNAFESWDHKTAWKIYDMIIENGIELSDHTYSIFLHDSKLRLNEGALENILGGIKANNIRNEHVATDLLHAMLLLHESRTGHLRGEEAQAASKSTFQRMLLLYSTYFELAPLRDFAPEYFTIDENRSPGASGRQMHPDCATLSLMVSAAIRCRIDQFELPRLYARFKGLVSGGHPDFVNVATEVNVFNAFIKAMGQHRDTLTFTTQILGDMLGAEAVGLNLPGSNRIDPKNLVSPSVQTWSVLVHAFMSQGQPRAAEKIVTMMKSRGMEPNLITWQTLITGYLQMDNMAGAVHSYQRAKKEGWTIDESIYKRLVPSNRQIMLDQQSETMPPTAESEESRGESEEQADTQASVSSPGGVLSLHRTEFQFNESEVFWHSTELKRVSIVTKVERLLLEIGGKPEFAELRSIRLRKASKGLKKLENFVDRRLYELEEELS